MPAPRVFKGREMEVTMEELAASGAAAITKRDSDDEEIPLIKSDITASPAASTRPAVAEAKKRKAGCPPKETRAAKNLKQAVDPEAAVESSQSALPSAEISSSSYYGASESPSPTNRKIAGVCKHTKTVPNQGIASVAQIYPCAQGLTRNRTDTDMRDGNDDGGGVKKDITEPVSVPQKRGRPRQTKTPILTTTTDKGKSIGIRRRAASARLLILLDRRQAETNQRGLIDSTRPTRRATIRNNSERSTPAKAPLAKAAPAKKVFASQLSMVRGS
ncbi:chromobox protein [Colletotrichum tofieldiae]|nr:chromobox protein [Colletotrichum tofieldiae]